MRRWLKELDRILRGEATRLGTLREESFKAPTGGLLLIILLMAALYGVCMGFYAGFREGGPSFLQWLAAIIKTPSLFMLTAAVTFPSLYVFNALVGSRLSFAALFQLLVASLAVNVAVLASLGPIVAFFSVSSTSYPFLLLLNIFVFFIACVLGFAFMLQTFYRLSAAWRTETPPPTDTQPSEDEEQPVAVAAPLVEDRGALWGFRSHMLDRRVRRVFIFWMVVFGLVIAQMAWVLRPFLGKPTEPFQWFCPRESNFFHAVWDAFCTLLS